MENDEDFSRRALTEAGLTLLPGRFLARETALGNPGENYVRIALVAEVQECRTALERLQGIWSPPTPQA